MDAAIAMARKYHYRFRHRHTGRAGIEPGGSMTGGSASRSAGISAGPMSRSGQHPDRRTSAAASERRPDTGGSPPGAHRSRLREMETAQAQRRELEDSILKLEERFQGYQSPMPSWTPSRPDFGRSWRRSRPDPARPRPIPGTPAQDRGAGGRRGGPADGG